MKRLLFASFLVFLIISCSKENENPHSNPNIPEEIIKDPLELFQEKYCGGYKVRDTTDLSVMGITDLPDYPNHVFLSGLRGDKLWISKFNIQDKELVKEFLGQENFPLKHQIHLGYGEYQETTISWITLNKFIENKDGWITDIILKDENANNSKVLSFNTSQTEKKYFYQPSGFYSEDLLWEWYNGSYLAHIDVKNEPYNQENHIFTCFSVTGDTIVSGYTGNLFPDKTFPINYKDFITFSSNYDFSEETIRPCINTFITHIGNMPENTWIEKKLIITESGDAIYNVDLINQENNWWTFYFDVTEYSGNKHDHTIKINIESGDFEEI